MMLRRSLLALALAAAVPLVAAAQQPAATPQRIRGNIEALDGRVLAVKTREGPSIKITLNENFMVRSMARVELASINANTYIGTAAMKQPDGSYRAIEVLVFPEAMRGAGEGIFPWDLSPESIMLNATVGTAVGAPTGRTLTLAAKGETAKVLVPPGTPVVTFAPAAAADLKPGARVFIGAQRQADGSLTAAAVTVGKDGVDPPM